MEWRLSHNFLKRSDDQVKIRLWMCPINTLSSHKLRIKDNKKQTGSVIISFYICLCAIQLFYVLFDGMFELMLR